MVKDINALTAIIADFRKINAKDSISPESLGYIMQRIVNVIDGIELPDSYRQELFDSLYAELSELLQKEDQTPSPACVPFSTVWSVLMGAMIEGMCPAQDYKVVYVADIDMFVAVATNDVAYTQWVGSDRWGTADPDGYVRPATDRLYFSTGKRKLYYSEGNGSPLTDCSASQTAVNGIGEPNGIAPLDADAYVPQEYLRPSVLSHVLPVNFCTDSVRPQIFTMGGIVIDGDTSVKGRMVLYIKQTNTLLLGTYNASNISALTDADWEAIKHPVINAEGAVVCPGYSGDVSWFWSLQNGKITLKIDNFKWYTGWCSNDGLAYGQTTTQNGIVPMADRIYYDTSANRILTYVNGTLSDIDVPAALKKWTVAVENELESINETLTTLSTTHTALEQQHRGGTDFINLSAYFNGRAFSSKEAILLSQPLNLNIVPGAIIVAQTKDGQWHRLMLNVTWEEYEAAERVEFILMDPEYWIEL